jgi:lysophospholipase L1-like esterase
MRVSFLTVSLLCTLSCRAQQIVTTPFYSCSAWGRTITTDEKATILIGSASYIEFDFKGSKCQLQLRNIAPASDYNYIAVEMDGEYTGRIKIDSNITKTYTINTKLKRAHHLVRIYKATESHNGQVVVEKIIGKKVHAINHPAQKKIEFIGNSITCGFGDDTKDIPCGTGKWYDQHNAYWAYGPRVARDLHLDFMLCSVSGIGIYRNWNSNGPTMPQVYESAYLDIDSTQRWNFNQYTPDIVSICLGTNDFSDGDGKSERNPFDSAAYISHYVDFIGTVYSHYPHTQIALLTSPMLNGEKSDLLFTCLKSVKEKTDQLYPAKSPVELFQFKPMVPKGCGYHPDIDDHKIMADELIPFFKRLVNQSE